MLAEWSLINFKSFCGETSLSFAPLTFFCGANSSGKSSVVQSILLIKQTIQHAPVTRPIALNGSLVRLGTFSEIENFQAHQQSKDHYIGMGWRITPAARDVKAVPGYDFGQEIVESVSVKFVFDTKGSNNEQETLEIQPSLRSVDCSAEFRDADGANHHLNIEVKRAKSSKKDPANKKLNDSVDSLAYSIKRMDHETRARVTTGRPESKVVACVTRHFIPAEFVLRYDRSKEIARQLVQQVIGNRSRRALAIAVNLPIVALHLLTAALKSAALPDARLEEVEQTLGLSSDEPIPASEFFLRMTRLPPSVRRSVHAAFTPIIDQLEGIIYQSLGEDLTLTRVRGETLSDAVQLNDNFFRFSVRYLGPLRDEPRSLYPLQALSSPTDVGPKGELTAAVLHLNSRRQIDYIPADCFTIDKFEPRFSKSRLQEAVVDWLIYLGIAVDIQTSEKGKFGHEFRVKTNASTTFQDLTNVGVGVSQVIPIVVTCLLAPTGSTIVLEQPELHLHPAVQARLADFFIAMSALGKQCIIETHGEYLIERMRLRIAGDHSDQVLQNTKIYFFQQQSGITFCKDVTLNRFGAIDDWPEDFFDQSQKESEQIVLNALERRKSERSNRTGGLF